MLMENRWGSLRDGVKYLATLLLAILLPFTSTGMDKRPLIILSHDRPPFHFEAPSGEVVGICVDIVDVIFDEMALEYSIVTSNWARVWLQIEKGDGEAAFSASRKKVREPFLNYPQTDMWQSSFVFFVLEENKDILPNGDINEIVHSGELLGIWRGASYGPVLWKHFPYQDGTTVYDPNKISKGLYNRQLYPVSSPEQVIQMVGANRVTFGLEDRIVGLYFLKNSKVRGKVTYYEKPLFSKGYPMPFIQNSNYPNLKAISEEFERRLIALKKDGRYQAIVDRWLYQEP